MKHNMQDYSPPPAEFPELPPEITPPGPECTPTGVPQPEPERTGRRRRLRFLLYAAAALVYLGLLFRPSGGAEAPVPAAPTASPTPTAAAVAAPAPTSTPTPAPEPTPEPTPESTELEVHLHFFNFSARHEGFVKLENAASVTGGTVGIWEKNLDSSEWSHELTAEEIAAGYYELPAFDDSETFFKYMDHYFETGGMPELELRVTLTTDEGELHYVEQASAEQGWGVGYWPDGYEPEWDWEECYPGCFAVMSYESAEALPDIRMGSYQDAWDSGAICVELTLNGESVDPADFEIVTLEDPVYDIDETGELYETGEVYYYTTLVIPRPAGAPEHGTAHFTVCQKLDGYDLVWVSNRDIEY